MRTLALAVVVLCGCFPKAGGSTTDPVTVEVVNNYSESLFTLSVTQLPNGSTVRLWTDQRIAGYANFQSDPLALGDGNNDLQVTLSVTSLGQVQHFQPVRKDGLSAGKRNFQVTYDFDLATANFVISYLWTY